MKEKLEEVMAVLDRGIVLLGRIDDAHYCQAVELAFGGSLGGHIRHDLDHYLAFFEGLALGRIDYEARTRDERVETDRSLAISRSAGICERLAGLAVTGRDGPVRVRLEGGGSGADDRWMTSSVGRELDFLLSHTIHHQALVSIICRILGVPVDDDFGVAPSTLRHRERMRACAP